MIPNPAPHKELPLALVTGAARRVGKALALHLAGRGFAVVLHYHTSADEVEQVRRAIAAIGVPVYPLRADLRDPREIHALFSSLRALPHRLTLLVNSAAVMTRSDLMEIDTHQWDDIMNINARAVWLCSREAAELMPAGGLILNMSDVGARKTWTSYGAYVLSKGVVESLTGLMARQLAPRVRVCGIAPGLLMMGSFTSQDEWTALVEKVPLRRQSSLDELLKVVDFLLENEYVTGEIINLAGGYQLT